MHYPCPERGSSKSNTGNRNSALQYCLTEHTPKLQSRKAFARGASRCLSKNSKLSLEREEGPPVPKRRLSYVRNKGALSAPPSIRNLKLVFQSLRHRQKASKFQLAMSRLKFPEEEGESLIHAL